ncbi:MAG: hypothetical protein GY953_19440, partial [bacterium]|nr:hypothetical protein [bacterium]
MKLFLAVLLLFQGATWAQFQNLSPTSQGDAVYFSTRLRLRGTDHLPWPKVYRWDANGSRLVEQSLRENLSGWQAIGASLSGDGRVLAVNSSAPCARGAICLHASQEFTGIEVDGTLVERFPAHAQVSHGGRYVLLSRNTGVGIFPDPDLRPQAGLSRYDVQTGTLESVGFQPAQFGRWIATDGAILTAGLRLVMPSAEERDLGRLEPSPFRAVLAGDASFFVYQLRPTIFDRFQSPITELRIRLVNGDDRLLAPVGSSPCVAIDSPRILYLVPIDDQLQVFVMDDPEASPVQVTFEELGVQEAAISGDGQFAYVVTGAGELVKLGLGAPSRVKVIAATPDLRTAVLEPV